jgi:integrase
LYVPFPVPVYHPSAYVLMSGEIQNFLKIHPVFLCFFYSFRYSRRLPRGIRSSRVFLWKGKPVDDIKKAFKTACTKAGLTDFTFHDLRHCAINNLRLAGNDYFKIMAMSGHKTMNVFKRYNLVTEEELSNLSWHDQAVSSGR